MGIRVQDLVYVYNKDTAMESVALSGVSVEIPRGKWTSIVGHTGSGKSTLAQVLDALLLPTSGGVWVDDLEVDVKNKDTLREIRRRVGLVFQYPEQQLFEETVREEIAFAPRNWGVPEGEIGSLVEGALEAVGLDVSFLDRNPFSLSGGEKRRVAIASVLAGRPDYLVLDEPTAGLDATGRRELLSLLGSILDRGTSVVMITHELEIAFSKSDKILVLEGGRLRMDGAPEEVARSLWREPVKGLLLPDVVRFVLMLDDRGVRLPVKASPREVVEALSVRMKEEAGS